MKIPSYSISQILKLKKRIESSPHTAEFLYSTLSGEWFVEFIRCLCQLLPGKVQTDVVTESCLYLAGEDLRPENLSLLAWRLAGNLWRLRNGHSVMPWDGCPSPEWVPVQITNAHFMVSSRGKKGANFSMRVLAGLPSGKAFEKFWTTNYCYTFASRLGFSRFHSENYPFSDVRQLVSLRFYAEVLPGSAAIRFDQLTIPGSCRDWNKKYIHRRARIDFRCPKQKPDELPCYLCPIGIDQCPVATHPKTYTAEMCPQCGKRAWFEEPADVICIDCTNKNQLLFHRHSKSNGDQI